MKAGLRRFADRLAAAFAVLTAALLASLAGLITYSVLLRYYFQETIGWATEISEYILHFATFFGAAWVLQRDEHVRIDILVKALAPRTQLWLTVLTSVVGALVCLALTGYGLVSAWDLYVREVRVVKFMALPKYIFILVIPVGLSLVAMQFLLKAWDASDELRAGRGR
jgi:TRAP-type C4-dicarboxylate transport system permease small subunit